MKEEKRSKVFTRKDFLKTSLTMFALTSIRPKIFGKSNNQSPKMILGRTGIKVTPLCFGASRTQESILVKAVLDQGINFFDTGRFYADGQNEVMLGQTLKGFREQVVIQSKLRLRIREEGKTIQSSNGVKKIKEQMEDSLDTSLKALQTDYIDILLFHNATSHQLLFHEAVLEFFEQAKARGKIRGCGFSAHNNHLEVIEIACANPIFDVVMIPYNHKGSFIHSVSGRFTEWDQPKLEKILNQLHQKKVGIIAMKTCSAGPCIFRHSEQPSYRDAIKWVLNKDFIDCAAVAMSNFDQVKKNCSILNELVKG